MRGWRNRQTRWIQVPVPARAWGFNSPLAHHEEPMERVFTSDESHGEGPFLVVLKGPGGEVSHGRGPVLVMPVRVAARNAVAAVRTGV